QFKFIDSTRLTVETIANRMSNPLKEDKPSQVVTASQTTESIATMEKIDLIYLKLAIDAIPILTQDNYTIWHTQILHYLDRLSLKEFFVECKGVISASNAQNVRTVLTSKMDATVHANVINHANKDDALLIWKSINDYFASQQAANRARVWNNFSYLVFNNSDILGFITKTKAAIEQLHEVGISRDPDILAYEIIKKLPKTPEFTGISTAITHSGATISPDLVLDHLRLYANQVAIEHSVQSASSVQKQVSLFTDSSRVFTDPSKKCKYKAHNTLANHPESRCWKLYPHLRPDFSENSKLKEQAEHSVSSFFSTESSSLPSFILDSGSSAHMTSNIDLFSSIDHSEKGTVRTSGTESLSIKGIGTIQISTSQGSLSLNNVLFVPKLSVNLLSVQSLVLDGYQVFFEMNSFSVSNSNGRILSGKYVGNLPTIDCNKEEHKNFYTSSEILHKSLGHTSALTLNQIPSHRSKNSPYELFKGRKLPLEFFKPVGNRVSYLVLPEQQLDKLESKGLMGTLIGYNDELRSYRILGDNGRIIDTSHLKFLDPEHPRSTTCSDDSEED
ncbi:hypothetical protein VP01_1913g1, partial [Puccinia sorghi]